MADTPDTRTRLLEAALDLVAESGVEALSHRRVEERAGLSHGSTTYHFGSVPALVVALYEYVAARSLEFQSEQLRRIPGWPELDPAFDLVGHTMDVLRSLLATDRYTRARFELYLRAGRDPELQEVARTSRAELVALQAEAFRALGAPDPERASALLLASFEGLLIHQLSVPDPDFEAWAAPWLVEVTRAAAGFTPGAHDQKEPASRDSSAVAGGR